MHAESSPAANETDTRLENSSVPIVYGGLEAPRLTGPEPSRPTGAAALAPAVRGQMGLLPAPDAPFACGFGSGAAFHGGRSRSSADSGTGSVAPFRRWQCDGAWRGRGWPRS